MKKKVAVLMSGGVDSSTVAYILFKQGYEVFGITLKLWDCNSFTVYNRQLCCSPRDIYDAKNICVKIGIPHYVLDFSAEFKKNIIEEFAKKYISGLTPNPCIWCNSKIKFGLSYYKLKKILNIDFIATGHYAKVVYKNGKYFIAKGKDDAKDQSYFLCSIPSNVLKYTLLPLGEFTKEEVKKIALEVGFENIVQKRESFDLCFIPEGDYRKFLQSQGYNVFNKGKIIDIKTRRFLGYHKGYVNYTVGQKRGLGIKNLSSRKYVVKIDPKNNIIYVGEEKDLYSNALIIRDCFIYDNIKNLKTKMLYAKIRYKSKPEQCSIVKREDNIEIIFRHPQRAVTPGQYAVVYDEENKIILSGEIVTNKC